MARLKVIQIEVEASDAAIEQALRMAEGVIGNRQVVSIDPAALDLPAAPRSETVAERHRALAAAPAPVKVRRTKAKEPVEPEPEAGPYVPTPGTVPARLLTLLTKKPLTALEMTEALKDVPPGTLYAARQKLEKQGMLKRVDSGDGFVRFGPA